MPSMTQFDRWRSTSLRISIVTGILILVILGAACFSLWENGIFQNLLRASELNETSIELGHVGPVSIVVLMMIAVVTGLFPGAIVAFTAGAVYGHTWGTIFVIIGAEFGAVLAFAIARSAGRKTIQRWFGHSASSFRTGSKFTLLGVVMLSRPLAFFSLDGIAFVAGLSKLNAWHFIMATLVANVPLAFLMGHFGKEFGVVQDFGKLIMVSLLVMTTMIIIDAPKWLKTLRKKNADDLDEGSQIGKNIE